MGKKILYLFLALLLPVCVFLFLKFFGKNEFEVAPMYQKEITGSPSDCNFRFAAPYILPDSIMDQISKDGKAELYVLNFSGSEKLDDHLHEEVKGNEFSVVSVRQIGVDSAEQNVLKNCILLMKPPSDVVLIDNQKRIRGYYQGNDREETDRLIVELKIILKKY